jgi:hypothetical protein
MRYPAQTSPLPFRHVTCSTMLPWMAGGHYPCVAVLSLPLTTLLTVAIQDLLDSDHVAPLDQMPRRTGFMSYDFRIRGMHSLAVALVYITRLRRLARLGYSNTARVD